MNWKLEKIEINSVSLFWFYAAISNTNSSEDTHGQSDENGDQTNITITGIKYGVESAREVDPTEVITRHLLERGKNDWMNSFIEC